MAKVFLLQVVQGVCVSVKEDQGDKKRKNCNRDEIFIQVT